MSVIYPINVFFKFYFAYNDNDNEKHFFSENNVQCYKYICVNKSMLSEKT